MALIPVAVAVPSLFTLAILAVLLCGLAAYETATSREFRRELRALQKVQSTEQGTNT